MFSNFFLFLLESIIKGGSQAGISLFVIMNKIKFDEPEKKQWYSLLYISSYKPMGCDPFGGQSTLSQEMPKTIRKQMLTLLLVTVAKLQL